MMHHCRCWSSELYSRAVDLWLRIHYLEEHVRIDGNCRPVVFRHVGMYPRLYNPGEPVLTSPQPWETQISLSYIFISPIKRAVLI
jgi:hypothetical protein